MTEPAAPPPSAPPHALSCSWSLCLAPTGWAWAPPPPATGPGRGSYQVVGRDGHREDFDAQVPGLVHRILQAPARLLVALQGVPVGHHNQVLVLLQVGAPARGWAAVRPCLAPAPSGCPWPRQPAAREVMGADTRREAQTRAALQSGVPCFTEQRLSLLVLLQCGIINTDMKQNK